MHLSIMAKYSRTLYSTSRMIASFGMRFASSALTACLCSTGCTIDAPHYYRPWDGSPADAPANDSGPGLDAMPDATSNAPRVLSTVPVAGASNAEPLTALQATFSEDMDPGTIGATTFLVLQDGVAINGVVTYNADSRVATFTPEGPLSLLQTYAATITTDVANADGTSMTSDHDWSFTIREGEWGTEALVELDDTDNATEPRVDGDDDGNAVALWFQSSGTQANMRANLYAPSAGWGTAIAIETNTQPENSGPDPDIAVNESGNAVAVWCRTDGTRYSIWANRFQEGAGWGTATLIETDDAGDATEPDVVIDPAGNAFVVWYQSDGTRNNIWANRYISGSGWSTAALIETNDTGSAVIPEIAIDQAGNAIASWRQADGAGRYSIWANRYVSGTGWGVATKIETDDTGNASEVQIASFADGKSIAVWHQHDGVRNNIWTNIFDTSAGWGIATLLESDDGEATFPRIALDALGNGFATWRQHDGTRDNIWIARYTASGWTSPALLETDNGSTGSPVVATDANGNAVALWHQSDGTRTNIWSNRYIEGAGWGSPSLIESDNAGAAINPVVAMAPDGSAVAVWRHSDGTRNNIRSNTFR